MQGAKELLNLDSNQKVLENLDNYNNIISKGLSGQENTQSYDIFNNDNRIIGELRSAAYSPYFKKVVGIAMMKMEYCKIQEHFKMKIVNKSINGEICNLPIT